MNRFFLQIALAAGLLTSIGGFSHGAGKAEPQAAEHAANLAAAPALADADGNKLFDNLEAILATMPADQPLTVIVRYRAGQEGAAAQIAGRVSRRFGLDRSVTARLTVAEIYQLVASDAIESIEANAVFRATRGTATASFGTAKASADFGLSGDRDGNPAVYSRQDLTIAVLDSGIDRAHPDFAGGKIIAWQDFVNGRPGPYDDQGHGTHVASIAAGAVHGAAGGVAPGASLVGVKVLDAEGKSSADIMVAALEWCIANREQHGIEVINLSLATTESSDGTDVVSRTVNRAAEAGLVVCVAAGNEGPKAGTIGSPGAAAGALTVGNMADLGKGGFVLHPSSSRGPTADGRVKPDLCGPGTAILAARANQGDRVEMTGTSMAAPFVAGVVALVLQASPALTPDQVKALLKETAVHFGPEGENNEFGAGRLDGYAALAKATGNTGTPPEVPDHLFATASLSGDGAGHSRETPIDDTRFPVAISLIMHDPGVDFDLYVYDPERKLVAKSDSQLRQDTLTFMPATTGSYIVVVHSYRGAGGYFLDVSAGTSLR